MRFIESEFFTPIHYRGKDYQEVVLPGAVLQLPAHSLKKADATDCGPLFY